MSNGFQHNSSNNGGDYIPPHHGSMPPMHAPRNDNADNLAIASVVTGGLAIVSTVCCCLPLINYLAMVLNPILAIVALITGGLALSDQAISPDKKTFAKIGIGLGIANFVFIVLITIIMVVGFGGMAMMPAIMESMGQQ